MGKQEDFYGSFELEKLSPELPLPKEVVEHAVVGRHMETVWDPEHMKGKTLLPSLSPHHILQKEARLGIPQGSACSSIIGAFCASRLPWVALADVAMLNYADDFLLLAKSSKARAQAINELTEAVGNLPGGTFKLSYKQESTAVHGISFLGHVLQVVDGKLTTWPRDGGEGLYRELGKIDIRLGKLVYPGGPFGKFDKQEALRRLAKCYAMVDGWRAAFKECDQVDRILWTASNGIKDWLQNIGATMADLQNAVTPDMEYDPDPYALGK